MLRYSASIPALLGILLASTSGFAGSVEEECERAQAHYRLGETERRLEEKRRHYRAAVDLCPNFAGLYRLGLTHLELGDPAQALHSFHRALTHVDAEQYNGHYQAYLLGRIAQARIALDEHAQAMGSVEQAIAILGVERSPQWLVDARRAIDDQTRHMSAEDFRTSLRSMRFVPTPSIHLQVNFDFDSASLTGAGYRQVEALGKALLDHLGSHKVLVVGHTDRRGTQIYNQALSERRADSVVRELERRHPRLADSLQATGKGETRLRYPGDSEADHRRNRRVEVRLLSR